MTKKERDERQPAQQDDRPEEAGDSKAYQWLSRMAQARSEAARGPSSSNGKPGSEAAQSTAPGVSGASPQSDPADAPWSTPDGPGASPPPRSWRTLGILTSVLVLLVLVNLYGLLWSSRSDALPDEVLGMWTTTASNYADRAFEIRTDTLVLHTGGSDSTMRLIQKVELDDLDGRILLTIQYAEDSGSTNFSFYYDRADGGVITFKNQPSMKWRRGT